MSQVFISYARSTEVQARRIAEALRFLGYAVWRDDELPAHRSYAEVIEERLAAASAVVVIWSAEAAKSQWVQSEADRAREARKLVQVTVDGAALPMPFDRIQCADLTDWNGETSAPAWRKLTGSIADLTGRAASTTAARPRTAGHRQASICVLPFANISGEPEQEYFSDGISEDIITDLSKVSALSVAARNTAFTFKGKSVDARQIARDVGVSHVLEGSVRKAGGRVRITAQLIDGAAGDNVWAERYDRDLTDIFALQDEISQAIVAALKLRLLPSEKRAITTRGTSSAEAYDLYLMARQYREAGNMDARTHEIAIRLSERAVALDPRYARAWALMANSQQSLVHNSLGASDGGAAAAERALQLDPGLGEPHALRARQLYSAGRRAEAIAEAELALRLEPDSYDVNSRAGEIYYRERRFADAEPLFERAAAASEADFAAAGMVLSTRHALGDMTGAREAAQMTLERAERALVKDRGNGRAAAQGVMALAVLGQRERAREWIDRALLLDPGNMGMRYNFACALSLHVGDADLALELLGAALASEWGLEALHAARSDPDLDPIRADSRFQLMMAEAETRFAGEAPA